MQGNRKVGAALAALLVTGVGAAAAHAADPPPKPPKPCTTASLFTDPLGDASTAPVDQVPQPGPDNMDITGFFVTTDADGNAFANIRLKNASLTMPSKAQSLSGIAYYFVYRNVDGTERFVSATITQDAVGAVLAIDPQHPGPPAYDPTATDGTMAYDQGHYDRLYQTDAENDGSFYPGPNGVVQIRLPDVFSGDTITDVMAFTYSRTDAVAVSGQSVVDAAPDDAGPATAGSGVKSYDVPACTTTTASSAKTSRAAKRSASRKGLKLRTRRAHR